MTAQAMRLRNLGGSQGVAAKKILAAGDHFEVVRVDAMAVMAAPVEDVVDLHVRRDGPDEELVREPVREDESIAVPKLAVAALLPAGRP